MKIWKSFWYLVLLPVLMGAILVLNSKAAKSAGYQSEQSAAKSKRFQIIADVEKEAGGNSLVLKLSLKNISSKDVNLRDTNVLWDYTVRITNEQGHVVAPTEKGQQLLFASRFVSHRDSFRLHPQGEIKRQIVLSKIYDLKPGTAYAVTVKRRLATQDGNGLEEIISNTVNVKVGG